MATHDVPAFVADRRAQKADQIARRMIDRGITAAQAARLTEDERREIEVAAGVKRPGSDRTWRVVVEMLAGSHMPGALCMTCGIGDPDGVPGPPKPYGHEGPCAR